MTQQAKASAFRAVIESPKGSATVNDDTNYTMDCFGNNAIPGAGETIVGAWVQIFFPSLATIPPEPDQTTAEFINPGSRRWRHPALDGSAVEAHEGEDHTFVIWFEFETDPMDPHVFQPTSSTFQPFMPNAAAKTVAQAKPKAKKAAPKKKATKSKPAPVAKATKKAAKAKKPKAKAATARRAKPKPKTKVKAKAKAKKGKKK